MTYESHNEIFRQGETLKKTYDYIVGRGDEILRFIRDYAPTEIVLVACGSSYWLSLSAALTIQAQTNIRSFAVKSSDVLLDGESLRPAFTRPVIIAPSRSGRTGETLLAIEKIQGWCDAPVLSIIEYEEDIPLAAMSRIHLSIPWANEVSVCQTRSFSNLYLAVVTIAALLGGDKKLLGDIEWYLDAFKGISENAEAGIRRIVQEEFGGYGHFVSLGAGRQYGIACQGAYISIEMAAFVSNYYGTLEYRHGPIATAGPGTLLALTSAGSPYEEALLGEARATGARVMVMGAGTLSAGADWTFALQREVCPEVVALYAVMVMQGLAHYKALEKGMNPDTIQVVQGKYIELEPR